jgi:hypothetical protein
MGNHQSWRRMSAAWTSSSEPNLSVGTRPPNPSNFAITASQENLHTARLCRPWSAPMSFSGIDKTRGLRFAPSEARPISCSEFGTTPTICLSSALIFYCIVFSSQIKYGDNVFFKASHLSTVVVYTDTHQHTRTPHTHGIQINIQLYLDNERS